MAAVPLRSNHASGNMIALTQAINTASKERLAILLHTLLKECNASIPIMARELLTDEFDSSDLDSEDNEDEDEDEEERPPEKSKKRARADSQPNSAGHPAQKRKLYQMCIQCDEEYNVTENNSEACQWHPGDMEPDYESDVWADHDERVHGTIADLGDENPEGFLWDCCDEIGTADGCEVGRHRHHA